MRKKILTASTVVLLLLIVLITLSIKRDPILNAFYIAQDLKLLTEIEVWEKKLGMPQHIKQKDKGNTVFYWTQKGFGVFAHPLYEGQYRRKSLKQWKVTSIIIPLKGKIQPEFLPVEKNQQIEFKILAKIKLNGRNLYECSLKEIKSQYPFSNVNDDFTELTTIPFFSPVVIRVYVKNNTAEMIEIRENSIFSWYD